MDTPMSEEGWASPQPLRSFRMREPSTTEDLTSITIDHDVASPA